MKGSMCRLYDESLVRNIMISTGLSILEYLKKNNTVKVDEICEFIEVNADSIISSTIDDMNDLDKSEDEDGLPEDDAGNVF